MDHEYTIWRFFLHRVYSPFSELVHDRGALSRESLETLLGTPSSVLSPGVSPVPCVYVCSLVALFRLSSLCTCLSVIASRALFFRNGRGRPWILRKATFSCTEDFVRFYTFKDGWTLDATSVLRRLGVTQSLLRCRVIQAIVKEIGFQGRVLCKESSDDQFRSGPNYPPCAELVRSVDEARPLQTADFALLERRSCSSLLRDDSFAFRPFAVLLHRTSARGRRRTRGRVKKLGLNEILVVLILRRLAS